MAPNFLTVCTQPARVVSAFTLLILNSPQVCERNIAILIYDLRCRICRKEFQLLNGASQEKLNSSTSAGSKKFNGGKDKDNSMSYGLELMSIFGEHAWLLPQFI